MADQVESVFLSYVRRVLGRWTGFQLALDHGMAGFHGKQKELWLGTEIENFFKASSNVTPYDMEEFVSEILNAEFNTVFEDNSVLEVSINLCNAFLQSQTNPNADMFRISQTDNAINDAKSASKMAAEVDMEDISEEEKLDQEMHTLTVREAPHRPKAKDPDGWITVTRRRN